jgi:hypothetical protein
MDHADPAMLAFYAKEAPSYVGARPDAVKAKLALLGALRVEGAFVPKDWDWLLDQLPYERAGTRLSGLSGLGAALGAGSPPFALAEQVLGAVARPVRAILFNKTAENNWPLGWHQDRTIAVAARHDASGFGPWTIKQGIAHVEPPFDVIAKMVTLRLQLDDVDDDNAPLRVALGSHSRGLIAVGDYDDVACSCDQLSCHAKAGDIWIYATPILHASAPAKRPRSRRVLQVDYAAHDLPAPLEWAGV